MASKKIDVYLKVGNNPEVLVDWVSVATVKKKIEWVKDSDSPDFEFYDIQFYGANTALSKDGAVTANKIKANNDTSKGGDHEYKITVKADGKTHTTTESGPPTGNRPVIRN